MKSKISLQETIIKASIAWIFICAISIFPSCSSSNDSNGSTGTAENSSSNNLMKDAETMKDDGKGVGPVKNVEVSNNIDDRMAAEGQKLFEAKCTSCHKWQKEKYVGPGLMGVTQRRKPEWIMNQILDPLGMTAHDPTAKDLLATYLTQMTNQNVTQPDARNILEYFRKMDAKAN